MPETDKSKRADLKVFISNRESTCDECGRDLGNHAWVTVQEDDKAACLTCADLDHLAFLPSGDAALTRRSKKYSKLSAVVLKWSRARKRYERQGLLVEEGAIKKAEEECEADADQRAARRALAAGRREELDQTYVTEFAKQIRARYPRCPKNRERTIAEHACRKYSGRVGRTSAAKEFDAKTVDLAVRAHIRHAETGYDELLLQGIPRAEARERVLFRVSEVLAAWRAENSA